MDTYETPITTVTAVQEAWELMLADMEAATSEIVFEQFIVDGPNTEIGQRIESALLAAKERGVRVTTVIDAVGSARLFNAHGVQGHDMFSFYVAPKRWPLRGLTRFLRDHRKVLVIDGSVVHMGGVVCMERAKLWNDLWVRIEDASLAAEARREVLWNYKTLVEGDDAVPEPPASAFLSHRHRRPGGPYYTELKRRIAAAQERVVLVSPYLAPPHGLSRALYAASKRGVQVTIVIPEHSDWQVAQLTSRYYANKFLREGIRVLVGSTMNHAKIHLADDWVAFGSFNSDRLSLKWNYEMNLVAPPEVAKAIEHEVEQMQGKARVLQSQEVTLAWWQKLVVRAAKWVV